MANSENNEGASNENLAIKRLKKVRGGNRTIMSKIEREANEIIRTRNPMNFEMRAKVEAMGKIPPGKTEITHGIQQRNFRHMRHKRYRQRNRRNHRYKLKNRRNYLQVKAAQERNSF
eukprot:gene12-602_t